MNRYISFDRNDTRITVILSPNQQDICIIMAIKDLLRERFDSDCSFDITGNPTELDESELGLIPLEDYVSKVSKIEYYDNRIEKLAVEYLKNKVLGVE